MVMIRQGRIEGGRLIVPEPVALPDGTAVRVVIDVVETAPEPAPEQGALDYAALPSFGMWADREDLQDSVAWVNQQRDAWRDRIRPHE